MNMLAAPFALARIVAPDTDQGRPNYIGDYPVVMALRKARAWNDGRVPDAPDPLWHVYDDTGKELRGLTTDDTVVEAWGRIGIYVDLCARMMTSWLRLQKYVEAQLWFTFYDEVIKEELMQHILGVSKNVGGDGAVADRMRELLVFVREQRICTNDSIENIRRKYRELRGW